MKKQRSYILLSLVVAATMLLGACSAPSSAPSATAPVLGYPSTDLTPTVEAPGYLAPEATSSNSSALPEDYPAPGAGGAITLTDGLNRTVTLPAPAKKIV